MTGTSLCPLKPRSLAVDGLKKLHGLEGTSSTAAWMTAMHWCAPEGGFRKQVLLPLLRREYIFERDEGFKITDLGLSAIGKNENDEPPPPAVGARYVAPIGALSARHRPDLSLRRVGSFDFLDIPSRMGDQLVPFKFGTKRAGGGGQE